MGGTEANITIDAIGDGNTMQYSIYPHDGSEPMFFLLYPDGGFTVLDDSNDSPYLKVEGSERSGADMVFTPELFEGNLFYDPEGNISIEVLTNEAGETQIDIYGAQIGDSKISVVPEKDEGTVYQDQRFDDPQSPAESYIIRPPNNGMV